MFVIQILGRDQFVVYDLLGFAVCTGTLTAHCSAHQKLSQSFFADFNWISSFNVGIDRNRYITRYNSDWEEHLDLVLSTIIDAMYSIDRILGEQNLQSLILSFFPGISSRITSWWGSDATATSSFLSTSVWPRNTGTTAPGSTSPTGK